MRKVSGHDLFYVDDDGEKQDFALHETILSAGDVNTAMSASEAVMRRQGFTDAEIAKFLGKQKQTPEQKVKGLVLRSEYGEFMRECVEIMSDDGMDEDDAYQYCEMKWIEGDEDTIYRTLGNGQWDEEEHPRDSHGRFTHSGGGESSDSGEKPSKVGVEFVSPSVANHLDFPEAVAGLNSAQQKALQDASAEIDRALHEKTKSFDIVGAWADGAENSVASMHEGSDFDRLRVSGAMKGWIADQKQVLVFQQHDEPQDGDAVLYEFDAKGSLADIHKGLLEDGIAFHTLVPTEHGATVIVADLDGSMADAVEKGSERYDAEVGVRFGKAEFIGTTKQDGSDREQRDSARKSYEEIIEQSPVQESREVWARVRDQWSKALDASREADTFAKEFPASNLLAQSYERERAANGGKDVTLDEIREKLSPEFKAEAAKAEAEMKGKMITQKQYMGEDGKYVPERAELHRKIIRELFTPEKIKMATPTPGTKPVLTLSGGRTAAGKTTSLKKELSGVLEKSFYINADEIQEQLPGYKGRHAGLYNAEAQDVALMAEKVARHMGLNIVYDATLKSKQPAVERVQNYIEAGYDVDGYFVHTTPATSVVRSVGRFMGAPHSHGRYIPLEIGFNSRTNESTFDSLIPMLRNWVLYDNNGKSPKRIAGNI